MTSLQWGCISWHAIAYPSPKRHMPRTPHTKCPFISFTPNCPVVYFGCLDFLSHLASHWFTMMATRIQKINILVFKFKIWNADFARTTALNFQLPNTFSEQIVLHVYLWWNQIQNSESISMLYHLFDLPGPFLLTWFNFNPTMDKYSHTQYGVGWNYLSVPNLQRCNRWSLWMDK